MPRLPVYPLPSGPPGIKEEEDEDLQVISSGSKTPDVDKGSAQPTTTSNISSVKSTKKRPLILDPSSDEEEESVHQSTSTERVFWVPNALKIKGVVFAAPAITPKPTAAKKPRLTISNEHVVGKPKATARATNECVYKSVPSALLQPSCQAASASGSGSAIVPLPPLKALELAKPKVSRPSTLKRKATFGSKAHCEQAILSDTPEHCGWKWKIPASASKDKLGFECSYRYKGCDAGGIVRVTADGT